MTAVLTAPRHQAGYRLLTVLAAVIAAGAAAYSGMATLGGDHVQIYLPLIAVLALGLLVLALTRFSAFVYVVLGVRSSVDLFRLSGASAGSTANNSAASRGLDPSTILGVLFLLAAGLWLCAQYAKAGRLPGSPLRLALVTFFAAGLPSILGSAVPLVSTMAALRILSVVMMYVVLEQLMASREGIRTVLLTCYVSMIFPLGYTAYGFLTGHPASDFKGDFTRITGPFTQSTTFARYLCFMIIFGVAILPSLTRRARIAMTCTLGVSSLFLLLTLTRGAIIGTVLGVLVVAIAQRRYKVIVGFVIVAMAALIAVPGLSGRLSEVGSQKAVGGAPTGNTLAWRLNYWTEILPLADRNPVTGIGLDMTQYKTDAAKQPHNDFIRAYVESGLLGLVAYVGVLWALVLTGVRAVRRTASGTMDSGIAVGFLACAIAFVVESAAANVISSVVCLWYLLAFAAAANAVLKLNSSPLSQTTVTLDRVGSTRPRNN